MRVRVRVRVRVSGLAGGLVAGRWGEGVQEGGARGSRREAETRETGWARLPRPPLFRQVCERVREGGWGDGRGCEGAGHLASERAEAHSGHAHRVQVGIDRRKPVGAAVQVDAHGSEGSVQRCDRCCSGGSGGSGGGSGLSSDGGGCGSGGGRWAEIEGARRWCPSLDQIWRWWGEWWRRRRHEGGYEVLVWQRLQGEGDVRWHVHGDLSGRGFRAAPVSSRAVDGAV